MDSKQTRRVIRTGVTYFCPVSCQMPSSLPSLCRLPFLGTHCVQGSDWVSCHSSTSFLNQLLYSFIPFGPWLMCLSRAFCCPSPAGSWLLIQMVPFSGTGTLGFSSPIAAMRPPPPIPPHARSVIWKSMVASGANLVLSSFFF